MKNIQSTLNSAVTKFVNEDVIVPLSTISSSDRQRLANLYKYLEKKFGEDFNCKFNQNSIVITAGNSVKGQTFSYSGQPEDGVVFENQKSAGEFDWNSNIAHLIKFMKGKGVELEPLPEIILRKQKQSNGLLDKTASYDKENKIIELYTGGRHVKDVLRGFCHEVIHHEQNLHGKLKNYEGDRITEDAHLKEIEEEATLRGYTLFREYTESLQK